MAKTKISEYDSTAANNTDIDSINIAEGCAPSGINNAIRELMAHLKDMNIGSTITMLNTTEEDGDGGRANKIIFKGEQSGGEESVLGEIQASHDGTADDQKGDLIFKTNDGSNGTSPTERLRLDSAGRASFSNGSIVTIGNETMGRIAGKVPNTDDFTLAVVGTGFLDSGLTLQRFDNSTSGPTFLLGHSRSGTIGSSTILQDGDELGKIRFYADDGTNMDHHGGEIKVIINGTPGANDIPSSMVFSTAGDGSNSASERMRIDSGGRLLVGKTASSQSTAGGTLEAGSILGVVSGGNCLRLNRLSDDGDIAQFRQDSGDVGAIATAGTSLVIRSQSTGLKFRSSDILPTDGSTSSVDNSKDLGDASARFDDVFATNTSIQTSDENEKQDIASLTSEEIIAATAISKLFKTYKWKDAVIKKGDNARTHTGVVAQQVQTAMSDAGLDASKYAFWCSDTWWTKDVEVAAVEAVEAKDAVYDDDGNLVSEAVEGIEAQDAYTRTDHYDTKDEAPKGATERTRLGVRYPELLAFIGAATEQRLTSIEARLDALEG